MNSPSTFRLLTESPAIKHISPVDQYLMKNVLIQKDDEGNANAADLAEIKMGINSLKHQLASTSRPNDYHLSAQHMSRLCSKCAGGQTSAYLDLLKHEMTKRIEMQVARGFSFTYCQLNKTLILIAVWV